MNAANISLVIFLTCLAIFFYSRLRHRLVLGKRASGPEPEDTILREKSDSEKPITQVSGVRLIQVETYKQEKEADIDIIAIHGLDTNSPKTWEWQAGDVTVNWLARPDMLPKTAERARIFYCDWPAELYERPDLIQKTVREFAVLLLAGIRRRPLATDDRPIIFIASCLGGVILMKALVNAGVGDEYLSLRRATRAIIFLATPFRGASFQDVADWAEPALKAWASLRSRKVSQLLGGAKRTFELEELVREFTDLCRNESYTHTQFINARRLSRKGNYR
ncbi:ARM repeat-containing protein [Penicillium sp. IBT 16267x]|nr:ARM repeat-containing protein [Penicillium sp. IBT 16267x]